jgi:hypothetical protein
MRELLKTRGQMNTHRTKHRGREPFDRQAQRSANDAPLIGHTDTPEHQQQQTFGIGSIRAERRLGCVLD